MVIETDFYDLIFRHSEEIFDIFDIISVRIAEQQEEFAVLSGICVYIFRSADTDRNARKLSRILNKRSIHTLRDRPRMKDLVRSPEHGSILTDKIYFVL